MSKPEKMKRRMWLSGIHKGFILLCLCMLLVGARGAVAANLSTIRDTEVEEVLTKLTAPVFKAAGLHPENVQLILVNNPDLNAFVAGGMNIFIYTGLLLATESPDAILGVIAHETGHIAGGHLARNSEQYKETMMKSALSYVLGAAAAVGGSPDAAMALIQGGTHIAQREMLQFSRENEDAADQAALGFLDRMKEPATGFLSMLEILNRKEYALYGSLNPYVLTHPLTRERIERIRHHVETSPYKKSMIAPGLRDAYGRMRIKLEAFLEDPKKTLNRYPESNKSINARYARAIAYYKLPDQARSLAELDGLISSFPRDPYFQELKGQILFEGGRVQEALPYYKKAYELMPSAPLIELGLAMTKLAIYEREENQRVVREAVNHLEHVYAKEPENGMVLSQLVIAYGKMGNIGMSNLYQAEKAFLRGNLDEAHRYARLAEQKLPAGSPAALRARDILEGGKKKRR